MMNKEDILKVKQLSIMNDGKSFNVFGVPLTELCDEALKGNAAEKMLQEAGVCPNCGDVPVMDEDGPFSHCQCGTGEDYGDRPAQAIQLRLMRRLYQAEAEIENWRGRWKSEIEGLRKRLDGAKEENRILREKLRWVFNKWVEDADPAECYPETEQILKLLNGVDLSKQDKNVRQVGCEGEDGLLREQLRRLVSTMSEYESGIDDGDFISDYKRGVSDATRYWRGNLEQIINQRGVGEDK